EDDGGRSEALHHQRGAERVFARNRESGAGGLFFRCVDSNRPEIGAMLQVGDIQIAYVSDGIVHVDAGGPFGLIPRALYRSILEPDADNLVPMALNCLLVRAGGKTIVVDTALGEKLDDKQKKNWNLIRPLGGLLDGLARLGVKAEDVDLVIDTHLHADHCAGNTAWNMEGTTISGGRPTFPNAEYVVQRRGKRSGRRAVAGG